MPPFGATLGQSVHPRNLFLRRELNSRPSRGESVAETWNDSISEEDAVDPHHVMLHGVANAMSGRKTSKSGRPSVS